MKKLNFALASILLLMFSHISIAKTEYSIDVSHNDEIFIINSETYKAKTYCFNMRKGDKVIFLKGSPLGVCVSATLLNLRTGKQCRVWCE